MKISIITAAYNSAATIRDTLESVKNQTHPDIEHIIIDGASKDNTVEIIQQYPHVAKWVSERDKGLYDAINKGIQLASGDFVGILNSDDFLAEPTTIAQLVATLQQSKTDAIYGDIAFVSPDNLQKVVRYYSSRRFHPGRFRYGYMPAHPSFYARKSLFEKLGSYKLDYKIAADYELLIRFLFTHQIKTAYLEKVLVYMRTGGISNASIKSRYILNQEIVKACREHGIESNMLLLSGKYLFKVFEYLKPLLPRFGKLS